MNLKSINVHSHDPNASLVSLSPEQYLSFEPKFDDQLLSVGVHPWDTNDDMLDKFITMGRAMSDPRVAAIGEAGLDPFQGADIDRQMKILRAQIKVSEDSGLPMILHVVRLFTELLRLQGELLPRSKWAIHGFRGKPDMAKLLTSRGIYLSLHDRFNPESAAVIPADKLLLETDEAPESEIGRVVAAVAAARGEDPKYVAEIARANRRTFLGR